MIREIFLKFIEPIAGRFDSDEVNEIRINPNGTVFEERDGQIHRAPVTLDPTQIVFAVKSLSGHVNQPLNSDHPKLDVRLPSGERVAILAPPIVTPGYAVTVRRFPKAYSIAELVHSGSLNIQQAALLQDLLVSRRKTLLVSGAPGSGKTTLSRALLNLIPLEERMILIEDPAEINLDFSDQRDMVSMELRPNLTAVDALKASLRHSPRRIVVGELRGEEAATFLEALNTGLPGSLTTLHANSAEDALDRLITLVRRGDPRLQRDVIVDTISRSIHAVAHMELLNGRRQLTGLVEVAGVSPDHTRILTVPHYQQKETYAA